MKKNLNISLWILVFAGLFFLLSFMGIEHKKISCKDLSISIDYHGAAPLIFEKNISDEIFNSYDSLVGKKLTDINALAIEEQLNAMDFVKNAEVYSTINGVLKVKVEQRSPLVRIMNKQGQSYYISTDGHLMPVNPEFSSRSLVASGNISCSYSDTLDVSNPTDNKELYEIYTLSTFISKDPFLKAQIEQVYLNDQKEFELVPKVGRQIIIFGTLSNLETKFDNLKLFYEKGIQKAGWDKYNSINLKFENQVVCAKK